MGILLDHQPDFLHGPHTPSLLTRIGAMADNLSTTRWCTKCKGNRPRTHFKAKPGPNGIGYSKTCAKPTGNKENVEPRRVADTEKGPENDNEKDETAEDFIGLTPIDLEHFLDMLENAPDHIITLVASVKLPWRNLDTKSTVKKLSEMIYERIGYHFACVLTQSHPRLLLTSSRDLQHTQQIHSQKNRFDSVYASLLPGVYASATAPAQDSQTRWGEAP